MQLLFHLHNKKSKLFLREFDETFQGRFPPHMERRKISHTGGLMKTQVFVDKRINSE